jgi:NitT/TauT family transport system substrate-binding protein
MKVANTAAVNDPQQCFTTAGQHPKLNFYKPGGVDIEYVNMSSMTQAMQSLRAGHVDFGPAVPGILLPAMAKDPTLDLVSVYKWLPRNANVIVVKPASGIRTAATSRASASACAAWATRASRSRAPCSPSWG